MFKDLDLRGLHSASRFEMQKIVNHQEEMFREFFATNFRKDAELQNAQCVEVFKLLPRRIIFRKQNGVIQKPRKVFRRAAAFDFPLSAFHAPEVIDPVALIETTLKGHFKADGVAVEKTAVRSLCAVLSKAG